MTNGKLFTIALVVVAIRPLLHKVVLMKPPKVQHSPADPLLSLCNVIHANFEHPTIIVQYGKYAMYCQYMFKNQSAHLKPRLRPIPRPVGMTLVRQKASAIIQTQYIYWPSYLKCSNFSYFTQFTIKELV